MDSYDLNALSIALFAALVAIGGIMGFVKAKSKPSLIAGVISAILLIWFANTVHHHSERGILRTFMLIAVLEGIFVVRLIKTKKFMPSGLMLILCVAEQAFLILNSGSHFFSPTIISQ